jgi:hypothetical protein
VVRRLFVGAIISLALAECILWLFGAVLQWDFAGFSLGPVYSAQIAEGARTSLTEFAWAALNIAGLIAYVLRGRGWGRWLMAAIQLANLALMIYLGLGAVIPVCGQYGWGVFWFAAIPACSLLLQYLISRRIDRQPRSSLPRAKLRTATTLALVVGALAVGSVLLGFGWRLSLDGIESHTGTVSSATAETHGVSVTIDSSSRAYFFSDTFFEPLPNLRAGDRVVILTGEACAYGTPLAVQSARGEWIDSIGGDAVGPFTPFTWQDHETLRWLLLSVGLMIELVAIAGLALWIG